MAALVAAFSSVAITVGIVGTLLYESASFFAHVPSPLPHRHALDAAVRRPALRHHAARRRHTGHHGRRARRRAARGHYRCDLLERVCARTVLREIIKPRSNS